MSELSRDQLTHDIAIIQLFHGRLGNDLSKSMAYHTGNFWYIDQLNKKNLLITAYLQILDFYDIKGDSTITEKYNRLSVDDIQSIIDNSYRLLEVYNTQ